LVSDSQISSRDVIGGLVSDSQTSSRGVIGGLVSDSQTSSRDVIGGLVSDSQTSSRGVIGAACLRACDTYRYPMGFQASSEATGRDLPPEPGSGDRPWRVIA